MRNKSLDAVKAIAACLVVCIHVSFPGQAGQLVKVLARCAVPFFFMVSGYFCYYQDGNASKRILSKILHIMKLFAVSVVFYFIWKCFMKAWNGERVWTWIKGLVSTEHLKEFFVYNSTSPVRAHLWFLPALIYCYLLALLIEKWRMRKAAYCMAPVLLAILLWRAEFCAFFDRFYHTMEYRNFLFTGMSFFLTGQMIHEYQDKIVCKRLEQWMQWGLKAGMSFGVGINAQISFQLGAKNIKNANIAATHGMLFNIIHGIIFTVICIPFMPVFLGMFTKEQEVISPGVQYSTIAFAFSTVIMISLSFEKIFQAVGRMKLTMISLMIGCISNIILDPLLIFGVGIFPEMGIRGAALATGLGQVFTVIVYLIAYKKCSIPVEISRKYLELNRNLDGKLYMVGIPAILNIALPSVLISFLNQILSAFSGSYVVVLGIYYKLQTFLYLPASGIVQGMRPLIGYNYGAGEIKRVKKLFGISVLLNGMIMLAGTIICFTASETLMGMFTENPETVRLGTAALQIISIGFIPSAISVTASGALEGLSKGAQSLVISLLRYIIVIIPAAYLLCYFVGADAVWNAFWICEFITAVVVGIGIKYYWNRLLQ